MPAGQVVRTCAASQWTFPGVIAASGSSHFLGLRPVRSGRPVYYGSVSERGFAIRAEDQPAWAEVVRRAERGESVAVIAHGDHVADVVPSGELDRLRETIEVLSDTELVRDLQEGLADARAGRVFPVGQVAADLAARRVAGE